HHAPARHPLQQLANASSAVRYHALPDDALRRWLSPGPVQRGLADIHPQHHPSTPRAPVWSIARPFGLRPPGGRTPHRPCGDRTDRPSRRHRPASLLAVLDLRPCPYRLTTGPQKTYKGSHAALFRSMRSLAREATTRSPESARDDKGARQAVDVVDG